MKMVLLQLFMAFHTWIYRISGGKVLGRMGANEILLLETVGRKSGRRRTTPLVYIHDGDRYVITASAGGGPKNPGWYHNLCASDSATIQVMDKVMKVSAQEAPPDERARLWDQLVKNSPQFKGYESKTSRQIPMMILRLN
jgi:F420H(2)-dependent quinone reductase